MTTLPAALADLFQSPLPVGEAVDRHFAATFRQRANGRVLDRAEFAAGVERLRHDAVAVSFTVLAELESGRDYAEHHQIDVELADGSHVRQDVYVFATRDGDGRFETIDEAAVAL